MARAALKPAYSPHGRRIGRPPKPRVIEYQRAPLYPKQEAAIFDPRRYVVIEAATKTGKTTGCLVWLTEQAALRGTPGSYAWWVAPVYKQAAIAYVRACRYLPDGLYVANNSALTIKLLNGCTIAFLSGEKPDNLYGEDVIAAVLDEATRMREAAWHAIRSTLTATRGPARLIGNVKGSKNFVHKLGLRAKAGAENIGYHRLTAYDAVEAGVLDAAEIEDARLLLPDGVFRELYLAEPTEDGANPFNLAALKKVYQPALSTKAPRAWGVDLAKSVDWTEAIALDEDGRMCRYERWQTPWRETLGTLRRLIGSVPALLDSTGVGDPIVEMLQSGPLPPRAVVRRLPDGWTPAPEPEMPPWLGELVQACPNMQGFVFTERSRQQVLEALAITIQQGECGIYPGENDILANQFEAFEYVYTREGRSVKYAAPEGVHDDGVMAYALALECRRTLGRYASAGGRLIPL